MSSIKINNPTSTNVAEFFGISGRRMRFLEAEAESYLKTLHDQNKAVHMLYLLVKFNEICQTPEELIVVQLYAMTHCRLLKNKEGGVCEHDITPEDFLPESVWNHFPSPN